MANIIKIHNKKFNWLQLGIIIVTLTAILVAAFFFFRPKPQPSTVASPDALKTAQVSQDLYIAADEAATLGDYGKGQSILDDALNTKTTDTERSEVYGQKSILALDNSVYDEAMTFAKKSEELNPTLQTAHVLAQVAEKSGDKALALKYYQLTVERADAAYRQLHPDDFEYYQSKVKELSNL